MSKLSFNDKISILVETSKSNNIFLISIVFLLLLAFLFFQTNRKNQKRTKILYLASTVFIIVLFITTYHSSLSNMFDYMMNNLFIAVYFPNLAIYLFAIIVTNIILWVSLFNYKTSKIIRSINILVYIIMNYFLYLLLYIVNKNKLDIFVQSSVYKNEKATAIIELSSLLFMIWVIFLIIYKIFLTYLRKDYKPKVKKVIVRKRVKKLPENYIPKEFPNYIKGNIPKKEITNKEQKDQTELLEEYDKLFTLEDYKLLLRILKSQKEKERLKKEKQEELQKEVQKYTELNNLYSSIDNIKLDD